MTKNDQACVLKMKIDLKRENLVIQCLWGNHSREVSQRKNVVYD